MSRPTMEGDDLAGVAEVLKSGWLTAGPKTALFEEALAKSAGAPHGIAVTSGTAGLQLLFHAMGLKAGDEVITPSMTFASTVNMIALAGATPVFVDCDSGTLNLRVQEVESKITARTRAIIPVHFAGAPCDLDPLQALAKAKGIPVIEDAAHAVGTRYKDRPVGGDGNTAVFSFHPIKNITTGEGGMVTTHDADLAGRLRRLKFHGIERDAWKRYGKGGNPLYDIKEPGFKMTFTDLQAALGLSQLAKLDRLNRRRGALAARYLEGLRGVAGLELPAVPAYPHTHAWHLFVVQVTGLPRDAFFEKLTEWNIGFGVHFPPCHTLAYVRERFGSVSLPVTERAGARLLSLPLFPSMSDADVDYVVAAVRAILAP
jgi:UDP-4-amino-4-deoxy-L-arabinose-oxoglutarate aminotransferase